jgi:hypothetical protein
MKAIAITSPPIGDLQVVGMLAIFGDQIVQRPQQAVVHQLRQRRVRHLTEVYSAGLGVRAAFMMSRDSVVWLRTNSDALPAQVSSAAPITAWIAGKSLARMRID